MKKFIIDIPDSTIWIDVPQSSMKNGLITFTTKSIPVEKLTPYTEPDRKAIEDEVWSFVNFLENKLMASDYDDIFDDNSPYDHMSYQEAKTKYEAWLKQKDEIHVGDEVIPIDVNYDTMIVTRIWRDDHSRDCLDTLGLDGSICSILTSNVKKTGRHFPEVAELLEKMKGEEGGQ